MGEEGLSFALKDLSIDDAKAQKENEGIKKTKSDENKQNVQGLENLPAMVQGVMSDEYEKRLESTTAFRKLISIKPNPPIQQVIDAGVVPYLVEFLKESLQPPLQFEAAWALTNIANGTSDHVRVVVQSGSVPIFVKLLESENDDVRETAIWALGNIAGDSPRCRDMVLASNALPMLLSHFSSNSKLSLLRIATWTLSNFCRGKPQPKFELVKPALDILPKLLSIEDDKALTDACWALSYLSDGPNEKIQAVIEAGVCGRLVELLMHPSPRVQTPALRTVGNIVTGDDMQTQVILDASALPCLLSLLSSPKKGIRKEACWTISNITAGSKAHIQAVIDANIVPPLISLLMNAKFDIRKESAWAISNATSGGTPEQIQYLVSQGSIRPLCDLLAVADGKIIHVVLKGLENILKVGEELKEKINGKNVFSNFIDEAEGLKKIKALQDHQNSDIKNKAFKITETYKFSYVTIPTTGRKKAKYEGNTKNGKRHGEGKLDYSNGDYYDGTWKDDEFCQGKCRVTYMNCASYEGYIINGERHGEGKLQYANGDVYKGGWDHDMRHGSGKLTCKNGDYKDGEWEKDDFTEGKERISYENDDV